MLKMFVFGFVCEEEDASGCVNLLQANICLDRYVGLPVMYIETLRFGESDHVGLTVK